MRGWIIKMYNDNNEFWGYKGDAKRVRSDDIRNAYIYLTKQMADKVAKHVALDTKVVEVEINEVEE